MTPRLAAAIKELDAALEEAGVEVVAFLRLRLRRLEEGVRTSSGRRRGRKRGTGQVFQKESGAWVARLPLSQGRRSIGRTFASRAEAVDALERMLKP